METYTAKEKYDNSGECQYFRFYDNNKKHLTYGVTTPDRFI